MPASPASTRRPAWGPSSPRARRCAEIDGRSYLLERPLRADLAIVRAALADRYGNLRFYRTARNFNPLMATAAKVTVVEADHVVPKGVIDPDDVHLPGLYVKRIVEVAGAPRCHRAPHHARARHRTEADRGDPHAERSRA